MNSSSDSNSNNIKNSVSFNDSDRKNEKIYAKAYQVY